MPTLVAQRGHVPRRTGATGTAGEQEVVTAIAAELGKYKPDGWKLVVINADEPLERYRGDVFVALHCDGSSNTDAHGASVGYQTAAGSALAQKWKSEYVKQGWGRGFRPDNYTAGLRGYYAYKYAKQFTNTYIVVEHGFLTNAQDAAWIRSHYAECAKAVWMAVAGSVKRPYKAPVVAPAPLKYYEVRIHTSEPEYASYAALAKKNNDFIVRYPSAKDSFVAWGKGV